MEQGLGAEPIVGPGFAPESPRKKMEALYVDHGVSPAVDLLSGTLGGVTSVLIGQSLDTVKVKMQTFPSLYRSSWHCFQRTLLEEGLFRGLYAGTGPSLAAQVSENAVLFLSYGLCQRAVAEVTGRRRVEELSPLEHATAGAGAACFASFVLCPTELIKCQLQALRETGAPEAGAGAGAAVKHKTGAWTLVQHVLRTEGVPGMFRGLVPTLMREIPGYFFFFGGYESSRYLLTPPGKTKDDIGYVRTAVSGGMGGVAFWLTIFPADVIKSRAQVQQTSDSFARQFMNILRYEGVRSLYRGLLPCLLRSFPATGALFLVVESTKQHFKHPLPPVD